MHLTHLSLQHFRNYLSLEFDVAQGPIVLFGDNAQGKTNLLEAIYLLSTGRSTRAGADRELMMHCLPAGELPFTRLAVDAQRQVGPVRLEMVLTPVAWQESVRRGSGTGTEIAVQDSTGVVHKRVRINGTARRLLDLIGQLPTVLFSPEDLELVSGSPAVRRRYLDITVAQTDPHYARLLQRYQRVVAQRNHLLRRVQESQAQEHELAFWDGALLDAGAVILSQRLSAVEALAPLASETHRRLAGERETLALRYAVAGIDAFGPEDTTPEVLRAHLATALERARRREIAQGQTIIGPHRDDLGLLVNGMPVSSFGSRGQQRTVALALKLAEAGYLRIQTGDGPILLLDDAFSEMDDLRRAALTEAAQAFQQTFITTADLHQLPPAFLEKTALYRVSSGELTPA